MIPYLPEGPPPLDEEDTGSPMDSPVAIMSVLQSLGAPAPTPPSPSSTPAAADSPPPATKPEQQPCDDNFDDFQSAPPPAVPPPAKDPTNTASSAVPKPLPTDNLVNGFPPTANEAQEDEEFGDFSSVPSEVELRRSVVEEESDAEKGTEGNASSEKEEMEEEEEDEDKDDNAFDDFQQADANDSDAAAADELTEADQHQLEKQTEKKEEEGEEFDAFQGGGDSDFADFQASTEDETRGSGAEEEEEESNAKEEKEEFDAFRGESDFAAFQAPTGEEKAEDDEDDFDSFRMAGDQGEDGQGASEDKEFDAFAGAKAEKDDFGGFQSLREDGAGQDADFGDFANFAEADNNFNAFEESTAAEADSQAGFGDFSQSNCKADEPIGFPAFESKGPTEPSSLLERILANMENVLSSCYASADDLPQGNEDTLEAVDGDEEAALWSLLIDFDKAFALQYQLTKSLGNECFLKALNIDSRNVLKNSRKNALPVFASQLGLLEPTRGQPESGCGGAAPEHSPSDSGGGSGGGDPSIPASEFDWTSSGLTNPLDSTNSNSYLDLDFFETSQLTSQARQARVKSELEEQFLCKELTAVPPGAGLEVRLDPVQSILTRVRGASTSASTKVETELSAEARAYLDRLANLDYMKARVLMFPVGPS